MRLADTLFRGGHLSEQALVEICMTGDRPVHLDRCDICADRAVELGRWLDDVRATGTAMADAAFPPERLAAQQVQILRRLEQLDQPSRVIAFPSQYRLDERQTLGRRVAPAWVGVGVAAGVVLGVVGGHFSARFGQPAPTAAASPAVAAPQTASVDLTGIAQHDAGELGRPNVDSLEVFDEMSPHLVPGGAVVLASLPVRGGGDR